MAKSVRSVAKRSSRFVEDARAGRVKLDVVMKNVDYEIVSGGGSIIGEYPYTGTEEEATKAIRKIVAGASTRQKLA
ncbi:hypothetical protein [Arthrobacter sp. UCD-GKA]|uniref:hypothetical protein n=1 Tax=Arthrobacter sp. UCD-GKA TaxID=1913576 RepID=UPI00111420C7|nr:hypothetical protein [Arthrobacter sp. UCD-GKA]